MILEVAILQVKVGLENNFERDFNIASSYIQSIDGYLKHSLKRCIEEKKKYVLLVEWNVLEDHMIGFRESDALFAMERIIAGLLRSVSCGRTL